MTADPGPPNTTTAPATAGDTTVPDTAEILRQLREKVASRVAAGQYPADLPESMDGHFHRLVRHRPPNDAAAAGVDAAIARARDASRFAVERIPVDSSSKYGSYAHKALRKVFFRQAQGIIGQLQPSTDRLNDAVQTIAQRVNDLDDSFGREVRGLDERWGVHLQRQRHTEARLGSLEETLDTTLQRDRTAGIEERGALRAELGEVRRDVANIAHQLASLREAVESLRSGLVGLQRVEADRGFRPWFDNQAFEARFRGNRAEILDRYRDLAKQLDGCSMVLDIGCGRGEMLELLAETGVSSYGIEIESELVDEVIERGFRAILVEARTHLAGVSDESLGGICMIQVVEHLTQQGLLDVVALCQRKLRPGGKLVIETVNAKSLYVYAHSFYLDPTHTRPVHPEYLQFLCEQAGFDDVQLEWRSVLPPADRMGEVPVQAAGSRLVNDNVERLNHLLYSPLDYAIVATK